ALNADGLREARARAAELAGSAAEELLGQGVPRERIARRVGLLLRYVGSDTALRVALPASHQDADALAEARAGFEAAYRQRFAFLMEGRALVIEAVSVEATGASGERVHGASDRPAEAYAPPPVEKLRMYGEASGEGSQGPEAWQDASLYLREQLK